MKQMDNNIIKEIGNLSEFVAKTNHQREQYLYAIKALEDRKKTQIELEQRKKEQILQMQLNDITRQLSELDNIERVFIAQDQSVQTVTKIKKTIENFREVLSKNSKRDIEDASKKIDDKIKLEIDKAKAIELEWVDIQKLKFENMINELKESLDENTGSILVDKLESIVKRDLKINSIMPDSKMINISEKQLEYDLFGSQYSIKIPQLIPFIAERNILVSYPSNYNIKSKIHEIIGRILLSANVGNIKLLFVDLKNHGGNFSEYLNEKYGEIYGDAVIIREHVLEAQLNTVIQHITDIIQDRKKQDIIAYNLENHKDIYPLYFILLDNFPYGINSNCLNILQKILRIGPKAGVHVLFFTDNYQPTKDLYKNMENTIIYTIDDKDFIDSQAINDFAEKTITLITTNYTPDKSLMFIDNLPLKEDGLLWSKTSTSELLIPIGRHHAKDIILEYNNKIKTHAHIIGKSGSGKSSLLHTIIMSACLRYSPNEIEVWLLDFKYGTEFKIYQTFHLPHARLITLKNEKEVALHVLNLIAKEAEKRGQLFKDSETKDYADYREKFPENVLPRILVVIDEYQLLFAEGNVRYIAERYIKDILEKGRSLGISILLSSQNAHVDSQMLGNISTRIVLLTNMGGQLLNSGNEKALNLDMGHGIFNDGNGDISKDQMFQSYFLPDKHIKDKLNEFILKAKEKSFSKNRKIMVFDGEAKADILQTNLLTVNKKEKFEKLQFVPGEKVLLDEYDYRQLFEELANNNLLVVPGFNFKPAIRSLYGVFVSMLPQLKANKANIYLMNFIDKKNSVEYKAITSLNTILAQNGFNIQYLDKAKDTDVMLNEIENFMEKVKVKQNISTSGILVIFNIENNSDFHYDVAKDRTQYERNGYSESTKKLQKILETGYSKKFFTLIQTNSSGNDGLGKVFWVTEADDLRFFRHRIALQMSPEESQTYVRERNRASTLYDEDLGNAGHNRCVYFDSHNFVAEKLKPFEFLSDSELISIIK
jgi:hypothetical protein